MFLSWSPLDNAWTAFVYCFAPMLGVLGAIYFWRWRIDRRQERVPKQDKLLRSAGESLRIRLEKLDEDFSGYYAVLVGSPALGATIFSSSMNRSAAIVVSVFFSLGVAFFFGWKIIKLANERRQVRLGFYGERAVGEELNLLMLDGCRVFHDVPNDPYGNIDHVIVAPSGVYVVETKTWRKKQGKKAKGGQREHEIVYDGSKLQLPDGWNTEALEQARQQADRLAKWLTSATGESVKTCPVLTFPGWYVVSRVNTDLKVLAPGQIKYLVNKPRSFTLPPEQLQRIAHQLEQRCRTVEL